MSESSERITRSKSNEGSDEALIHKVMEKILTNKSFLEKLFSTVKEALSEYDKSCKAMVSKMATIEDQIEEQEQYSRLSSLRIYGLPEEAKEDTEKMVIGLCNDKLGIRILPTDIDSCYRLKHREGSARPIIVRFCRRTIKNQVFNAKKKLKGSKIVIREDLTRRRAALIKRLVQKVGNTNIFTYNAVIFAKFNNIIYKIKFLSDLQKIPLDLLSQ